MQDASDAPIHETECDHTACELAPVVLAVRAFNNLAHHQQEAFAAALFDKYRAGTPIAPFDGVMEEALLWADFAMPEEIEAYAVACFKSMAPGRQRDFLNWAARSEVGSAA